MANEQAPSQPEVAVPYLAGIIDGEGYVGVVRNAKNSRCFVGRVVVQMATPQIPHLLQQLYGGAVRTFPRPGVNQRDAVAWEVKGAVAVKFLSDVLPFLILKRKQAEAVLQLYKNKQATNPGNHPSDATLKANEDLYTLCKELNKRGKLYT